MYIAVLTCWPTITLVSILQWTVMRFRFGSSRRHDVTDICLSFLARFKIVLGSRAGKQTSRGPELQDGLNIGAVTRAHVGWKGRLTLVDVEALHYCACGLNEFGRR